MTTLFAIPSQLMCCLVLLAILLAFGLRPAPRFGGRLLEAACGRPGTPFRIEEAYVHWQERGWTPQ